eukprot:jgi/Picre1/33972/NNA_001449.t1
MKTKFPAPQTGSITEGDIIDCTIIGQIDRKFIAFKSASGNLGLVDQHAADERVRLEVLQSQVFLEDGHPNPEFVQSWKCPENLHVYVGQDEVELFDLYKTHANAWGWRWEPWCPSTKSILVTHVPLIYHKALSGADLKLYIHQLVETSACRVAPQGCYRVLASIACRGAIMFGDALTMDQARALIEYALNAVNSGATSLGIKASNGVVLATEKKLPSVLVDESTVRKISW